ATNGERGLVFGRPRTGRTTATGRGARATDDDVRCARARRGIGQCAAGRGNTLYACAHQSAIRVGQKMASVKFLEEVLSKDVDENAFSAIVVSLESELVTNTSVVSTSNRSHHHNNTNTNNSTTSSSSNNAVAATAAAPQKQQQQHVLVNGARAAASSMNKCIAAVAANNNNNSHISHCDNLMPGISQADFVGQQQQQQQQQQQHHHHVVNPTLAHNYAAPQPMKSLDQVKVVYSNSANSRNYVPVNSLPNGTINSTSTGTGTAVVIKSTPQQLHHNSPPVSTMTLPGQVSSNQSSVSSNVITVSKQMAQGVVTGNSPQTILPANVQILNVNALRPQNSQGGVNKNMSRVMIPQVVGARPGAPGLTLQTLQQAQGGHILLKTENGQYQLLRVGPAPSQGNAITQNNANFRVQSVPSVATNNVSIAGTPTTTPTQTIAQPQQAHQKIQQDNTKEKCRKFLANLLELSSKEPKAVERSVRTLIQELVDAKVEPEQFCDRLEKLLNASPQPCLIGFLKKSLPLLRQSLMLKEMVIDGIRPPQLSAQPTVVLANQQQAAVKIILFLFTSKFKILYLLIVINHFGMIKLMFSSKLFYI
ncbi:transcription initiation factor TFIID subunit 4, partial [Aphis craccivora]